MTKWQTGRPAPPKKITRLHWAILGLVYYISAAVIIYQATEKSLRGESSGDWPVVAVIVAAIVVGMGMRWRREGEKRHGA